MENETLLNIMILLVLVIKGLLKINFMLPVKRFKFQSILKDSISAQLSDWGTNERE